MNPKILPLKVSDIAQTMLFKTLWDRLPNKSFISGLWLREYARTPLWNNCFMYILPIKQYPYFRHYFGNVLLSTPGERGLWMDGTEEERISYALDLEEKSGGRCTANWKAVKELESELKNLYDKTFPYTYKGIVGHRYTLDEQKRLISHLNKKFWDSFEK